jgi:hypothetical protein
VAGCIVPLCLGKTLLSRLGLQSNHERKINVLWGLGSLPVSVGEQGPPHGNLGDLVL